MKALGTLTCAVCFLMLQSSANATILIRWADEVNLTSPAADNASGALGAPDGDSANFELDNAAATYSAFDTPDIYSKPAFASLLGITASVLNTAEFLAFEINGNFGVPFETSTWTFSSGTDNEVIAVPDAVISGGIDKAAYANFFGFPVAPGDVEYVFALFDLTEVDPTAPDFEVLVQRSVGGQGTTPNVDAMGVLPEPSTALFALMGACLIGRRRRSLVTLSP